MSKTQLFCTFYVDERLFGVPVDDVQEILRHQETTSVPLADETIEGLINLRGQIVMAIDLRRRLRCSERAGSSRPSNVVVRVADGAVSLLVDQVGEILEVDADEFEPNTRTGLDDDLVEGVYKLPNELLLALNVEQAVTLST